MVYLKELTYILVKTTKIFDPNSLKKVIGFDTFEDFTKTALKINEVQQKFLKEANFNSKNLFQIVENKIKNSNLEDRSILIKGDIRKLQKFMLKIIEDLEYLCSI